MSSYQLLYTVLCIAAIWIGGESATLPKSCNTDDHSGIVVNDGDSSTIGSSWVGCVNGQIRVLGCVTGDGTPIALGDGIQVSGYELTCVKTSGLSVHLRATSCIYGGKQYQAGENIPASGIWYNCKETPNGVMLDTVSCSDEDRRQIKPGGTVVRGDYQYTCTQSMQGTISLKPTGCITNSVVYGVGSTFAKSKFIFECVIESDGSISMRMKSCAMPDGKAMGAGEKYYRTDGFIVQCNGGVEGGFVLEITGCINNAEDGTVIEQKIGSLWLQRKGPFKFWVQCKQCEDGSIVYKTLEQCIYLDEKIDPGCFRTVEGEVAICSTNSKARLQTSVRKNTPEYLEKLVEAGFKQC